MRGAKVARVFFLIFACRLQRSFHDHLIIPYMRRLLGIADSRDKSSEKKSPPSFVASPSTDLAASGPRVLVIDSDAHDWRQVFGGGVQVEQGEWEHLMVTSEAKSVTVHLRGRKGGPPARSFMPDVVLVRKLVRGLTPRDYHTNALYGLLVSGVPAVNSLSSIRACLERPLVYAALHCIAQRLGEELFPLLPLTLSTDPRAMAAPQQWPAVLKVSSAEAGFGKMRVRDEAAWRGLGHFVGATGDYATVEEFVAQREYDIRVQRVGAHLRAYHRQSSNWKGNVGSSVLTEVSVTAEYRRWAEACAELFGGIDILTVDAIHTKEGKNCAFQQ